MPIPEQEEASQHQIDVAAQVIANSFFNDADDPESLSEFTEEQQDKVLTVAKEVLYEVAYLPTQADMLREKLALDCGNDVYAETEEDDRPYNFLPWEEEE